MDSSIGKRLKQARESRNLKQAQVCEDLAIASVQSLSAYENGKTSISADLLVEFSQYYGVSADWLLFGKEFTAEKSPTDYYKMLVNAVDYFGFKIVADESLETGFTHIYQSIRLTDVYWGERTELDEFSKEHIDFISKWARLRGLVDDKVLTNDEYQTLIDAKLEDLSNSERLVGCLRFNTPFDSLDQDSELPF